MVPCGSAFGEVEDYLITIHNTLTIDKFDQDDITVSIYPNPSNSEIFVKSVEKYFKN